MNESTIADMLDNILPKTTPSPNLEEAAKLAGELLVTILAPEDKDLVLDYLDEHTHIVDTLFQVAKGG